MTDDFSNLETGASCYVLNSATSIYSYKNSMRKTYTMVGGKWFETAQSSYSSVPSNSVCWSYSDITALSSNSDMYPIYMFLGFCLAIVVYCLWWFIFRRMFKWRIS